MTHCSAASLVSRVYSRIVPIFQAGPLRQYDNSPYADSNDAVHAGSAQTLWPISITHPG